MSPSLTQLSRPRGAFLTALLALTVLLAVAPSGASAAEGPQPLWQRCDGAAGDLSCSIPRGIGVSPVSGHLYVAESNTSGGNRIDEYTAWGEFVRAWGWGVSTGAEEPQTCTTASSCKAGIEGGGKGQLAAPLGVAVDSAGNVYVTELFNHRVQKFDSEGHFTLMFGGQVNKTKVEEGKPEAEQNRCPVDPSDVCQAGTAGGGNGQFTSSAFPVANLAIGPSPGNLLYVGDAGRVQVFNPNGTYKEDFPDSEGLIAAGGTVKALAAAPSGGLYLAFDGKADVTRLTSAGKASVSPGCTVNTANPTAKLTKPTALAMATNAEGKPTGNLYVFDETHSEAPPNRIRQFSAACADKEASFAKGDVSESTGLAAGTTCLTAGADVYLSNSTSFESGYVRAYGSAPDKTGLCPKPLLAPQIVAQYAVSVGTVEAQLRAQISPRFYADTTYQLQYGTAACLAGEDWEAPCVKDRPPGPAPLGADAVDFPFTSPSMEIGGLTPATTYRYRFLAQSSGGLAFGTEQSFTTFAAPSGGPPCPNEAFRIAASALLPDCRAYELVSPVDKEGGQILTLGDTRGRPAALDQSASSGDKLTYSSYNAFGDPESSPFTSQYIANREPGGWASHGISPPRGAIFKPPGGGPFSGQKGEFEAFSADLCSGWLGHDKTAAPPLAVGAAPYNFNLYRRSDCGAGAGSYVALAKTVEDTRVQGVTADGGTAIFRTNGHLSQEAAKAVGSKLNCESPTPAAASFQWLREGAPIGGATTATYTATAADEGKAIQCRMSVSGGGAGSVGVANPAWVIAPYPATAPPLAPASIPAPSASESLEVGGAGGQTLGCDPGAWQGAEGFSYQWYRNGAAIAGANEATYEVQAADLASAAYFQCEATGENAGGKVAEVSDVLATSPAPAAPISRPNMTSPQQVLYESGGAGGPRAVCILPGGTESGGCSAGTANLVNRPNSASVSHALSADGSRVFWTNFTSGEGTIYLRLEGKTTVPISEAATSGSARFWTAAKDGSRAIISSADKLYEIGLADPEAPVATLIAEGFAGVVGASEDASLLYFASTKALTGEEEDEENSEGATAQAGRPNLYLRRAGEGGGTLSFVGTLAAADVPNNNTGETGLSPVAVEPYEHAARVSADGGHVAFISRGSLSGYDNADGASGEADAEVFLYDADAGKLVCASCNPSGARPSGRVVFTDDLSLPTAAQLPPIQSQLYASHLLAEDGSRLFFESYEPLLLADTNGKADVYEWEEAGAGSCKEGTPAFSALNEGCLSLISSGKSPVDSILLDAKPDGRDVFFTTGSSLLPYDPGSIDIYDAREGGGLPAPPAPQPPCEGEACQSPPPPPAGVTPASAAFRGQGNPVPRKHKAHKHKQHKKHKRAHGQRRAGR